MRTIVIVDSKDVRRLSVSLLLREHFVRDQIYDVASLSEVVCKYNELHPEVVIIGGFQYTNHELKNLIKVCKLSTNTHMVVYSDLNGGDNLNKFLDLGIRGVMATSEVPAQLGQCIEGVLKGSIYISRSLREYFLSAVYEQKSHQHLPVKLSRREIQVARHLSNGMKISRIADFLNLTVSSISKIKSNVFTKLNVTNASELNQKIRLYYSDMIGGSKNE